MGIRGGADKITIQRFTREGSQIGPNNAKHVHQKMKSR